MAGKHKEAEKLFRRSLAIWEKTLGPNHSTVAASLSNLSRFYTNQGKLSEAARAEARANVIRTSQTFMEEKK
jgi:hypothetical protein